MYYFSLYYFQINCRVIIFIFLLKMFLSQNIQHEISIIFKNNRFKIFTYVLRDHIRLYFVSYYISVFSRQEKFRLNRSNTQVVIITMKKI